jgi:hypothetical protein
VSSVYGVVQEMIKYFSYNTKTNIEEDLFSVNKVFNMTTIMSGNLFDTNCDAVDYLMAQILSYLVVGLNVQCSLHASRNCHAENSKQNNVWGWLHPAWTIEFVNGKPEARRWGTKVLCNMFKQHSLFAVSSKKLALAVHDLRWWPHCTSWCMMHLPMNDIRILWYPKSHNLLINHTIRLQVYLNTKPNLLNNRVPHYSEPVKQMPFFDVCFEL